MREANARRKICANSLSRPPIPILVKSKSGLNRGVPAEPSSPPASLIADPCALSYLISVLLCNIPLSALVAVALVSPSTRAFKLTVSNALTVNSRLFELATIKNFCPTVKKELARVCKMILESSPAMYSSSPFFPF
eukprot:TRINITY_DN578_c0_g1_i2.p1 TRINITY_DN578_c0_g1~~TRINITY_DN578_c0_g1_i2.p1  ORF type:complete len:136 (+),score=26.58 TRINITY_DN578_c0_g1_i2:263-670(+)